MAGGRTDEYITYLVKYASQMWEWTVKMVVGMTPFARELVFWDRSAFWELTDSRHWEMEGGRVCYSWRPVSQRGIHLNRRGSDKLQTRHGAMPAIR